MLGIIIAVVVCSMSIGLGLSIILKCIWRVDIK